MNLQTLLLIFSVILISNIGTSWKIFKHGRPRRGMLGVPHVPENIQLPPDQWFEQHLDHFNPTDSRKWMQRYFTNDTFFQPGGPVFLMIGGEGEASPKWMVQGAWIDYAQKYNALCFQLEHRFYGKSHPTEDMSVKNLMYLSSEQALADIAVFIEAMTDEHKLENNKWIAFGGSYPGSLAAWVRIKYPHLIHGAMSASGPLLAIADFKDYYGVVRDSLSTYSDKCVTAVENATKEIDILLRHVIGRQTIEKLFRLCDSIDTSNKNDISNFYETLAGNMAGVVQYNRDNREFEGAKASNITIDVVCDAMVNDTLGRPFRRYALVNSMLLDAYGEKCLDFKYDKMIEESRGVSWNSSAAVGGRQWTYQTCTEFGFFQTSSLPNQPFGTKFPVEFFIQQCTDIFGPRYSTNLLDYGIGRTNTLYGAYDLEISRVVFVHGSIDPWHALGIRKNLSADALAIYIEGTAHCANMYPPTFQDLPQLQLAREEISTLIGEWIHQ